MVFHRTNYRGAALAAASAFVLVSILSSLGTAQDQETPKYDIFVGYQWLHPGGSVPGQFSTPLNPIPTKLPDMGKGIGAAVTYNFTSVWGLEGDIGQSGANNNFITTVSAGPRLMFRSEDAALFIHAMLSYNRLAADFNPSSNGIGGIIGGGMDLKLTRSFSWRVFEADWQAAYHHYPAYANSLSNLNAPAFSGVRLRTGIVFNVGYPETKTPSATVTVQPAESMVGEPITATAKAADFNPKHTLNYEWSSTCGKISGKGDTASIDTNGAPGGNCTATVKVTDPKAHKNNEATASTNFTVKEPPKNPPTVSCTANPTTVQVGGTATISCTCTSPDNVPVNLGSYTASSGSISGNGNTATLNTTGASPGTITVNATCSDQRGLNTPATAQVTVEAPPPPPPPQVSPEVRRLEARLALHSIYFPTALPTAAKPEGGLVKSQQQTLTDLASDFKKYLESKPDAHLILEGHADPRGSDQYNQALSERRVNRTKGFLIEQGVPAGNIETKAFGKQQQLTEDQVKGSIDQNTEITPGERQRIVKNMRTIMLASNRRVDVTLNTTGQESVRQFPFNATDALTLIGGREKPAGTAPAKTPRKKPITKKK